MIALRFGRYALGVGVALAMLTGCGAREIAMPSSALDSGMATGLQEAQVPPVRSGHQYKVLYSFGSGSADGVGPAAALVFVNGLLYGTTLSGGSAGLGTIFSFIPSSQQETVIYSFKGGRDGSLPHAGLLSYNGGLYGTTAAGGQSNYGCAGCGTVFSLLDGRETVMHSFGGGDIDGDDPWAGLIAVNGTLYGTTTTGDNYNCDGNGCGAVFAINPTNDEERVVYGFKGETTDGSYPLGGLVYVGDTFYGTTTGGGAADKGTVYALDNAGNERLLYSFQGGVDGAEPATSLASIGGTLYGTTYSGGITKGGCKPDGCGTVFSVDISSGQKTTLYAFKGGRDGQLPAGALVAEKGVLYGTTFGVGTYGPTCSHNCGTVFAIKPGSPHQNILHHFEGYPDGSYPEAALLDVKGDSLRNYGRRRFGE